MWALGVSGRVGELRLRRRARSSLCSRQSAACWASCARMELKSWSPCLGGVCEGGCCLLDVGCELRTGCGECWCWCLGKHSGVLSEGSVFVEVAELDADTSLFVGGPELGAETVALAGVMLV